MKLLSMIHQIYIFIFSFLGLNFLINGKCYSVPMVVEEPSVIAAASAGAKFIAERSKGFITSYTDPLMLG